MYDDVPTMMFPLMRVSSNWHQILASNVSKTMCGIRDLGH